MFDPDNATKKATEYADNCDVQARVEAQWSQKWYDNYDAFLAGYQAAMEEVRDESIKRFGKNERK